MIGAFVSLDLFLFYVFWELMLIPMYVMIGVWGGTNRIKAALKFFLYTMFGSMLMLAAILYLAYTYGRVTGGPTSFDYFELQRIVLPRNVQIWLFAGVRRVVPHQGADVPGAHVAAGRAHRGADGRLGHPGRRDAQDGHVRLPALLHGALPRGRVARCAATLAGVAVLGGILYGALCAWRQDDVKRLVAYSSVAHLGYVMLGLFAATPVVDGGRGPPDGEPRHLDRRALPPRRRHLRPPPHAHARRLRRPREGRCRSTPRSSSSRRWRASACPGPTASSASS